MTEAELNQAVARATGESVVTIAQHGFVPLTPIPQEREPLTVDWDEVVDARRRVIFPWASRAPSRHGRTMMPT